MLPPKYIKSLKVFNELSEEISVTVTQENKITAEGDKVTTFTIAPGSNHVVEEHTVQSFNSAWFVCPVSEAKVVTTSGSVQQQKADLTVGQIVGEFRLHVKENSDGKMVLVGKEANGK